MRSIGDSPRFLSACFLHSSDGSSAGNWSNERIEWRVRYESGSYCRSFGQFLEENLLCEKSEYDNKRIAGWPTCQPRSTVGIKLNEIVVTLTVELHLLDDLVGILNKIEDIVDLMHLVLTDDPSCNLQQNFLADLMRFHENFHLPG